MEAARGESPSDRGEESAICSGAKLDREVIEVAKGEMWQSSVS